MANQVQQHFESLRSDPFRTKTPFSADLEGVANDLVNSATTEDAEKILCGWLASNQPCLFGRIAARFGGLSFCFLTEADLVQSDEAIHEKIQRSRRAWWRKAFRGDASGFVIVVISDRIAQAIPDEATQRLAKRLCYLYLGRDDENSVLLEDIFLRIPGREDAQIHWKAGVNYFSAQADQRWWHDHRIPAGMAFSINSVGHMVKAFQLGRSAEDMWKRLGLAPEEWANLRVESLEKALVNAMLTIDNAAATSSGKATLLLPAEHELAKCPVHLPQKLMGKSCFRYFGYYHTDYTLPSEYFRADIQRPGAIEGYNLDFTYLFSDGLENPAFAEMGRGVRVQKRARLAGIGKSPEIAKRERMSGREGFIAAHPSLIQALEERE